MIIISYIEILSPAIYFSKEKITLYKLEILGLHATIQKDKQEQMMKALCFIKALRLSMILNSL